MEWPSRLGRERRDVSVTNTKSQQVSQGQSAPAQLFHPSAMSGREGGTGTTQRAEPCA